MSNVYKSHVRTKEGELRRFRQKLVNAGFKIPPTSLVESKFKDSRETNPDIRKLQQILERFKKISKKKGPYLPYLMLRNNGKPQGTGEGVSIPISLEDNVFTVADEITMVQESDSQAKGVIVQLLSANWLLKKTLRSIMLHL